MRSAQAAMGNDNFCGLGSTTETAKFYMQHNLICVWYYTYLQPSSPISPGAPGTRKIYMHIHESTMKIS